MLSASQCVYAVSLMVTIGTITMDGRIDDMLEVNENERCCVGVDGQLQLRGRVC
jgi:hypothetical protein